MSPPRLPDRMLSDALRQVDATQNVLFISQILIRMMQVDPLVTFRRAEEQLRALGSKTYLLALPSSARPPELDARNPITHAVVENHLWICLHGAAEAAQMMQQWGIEDASANLSALEECGVLTLREN